MGTIVSEEALVEREADEPTKLPYVSPASSFKGAKSLVGSKRRVFDTASEHINGKAGARCPPETACWFKRPREVHANVVDSSVKRLLLVEPLTCMCCSMSQAEVQLGCMFVRMFSCRRFLAQEEGSPVFNVSRGGASPLYAPPPPLHQIVFLGFFC